MRGLREKALGLDAPRLCACIGPQPGHTLCPCRERTESMNDAARSAIHEARHRGEVNRLKRENAELKRKLARVGEVADRFGGLT